MQLQRERPTAEFNMLTPTPMEEVAAWLDSRTAALPAGEADVAGAAGRVLAAPVDAAADLPPTATAEVDGFALQAEDTVGASEYNPLVFRVASATAGSAHGNARPVGSGRPLPQGADTVIPLPEADLRGEALEVYAPLASGENVIPQGREARHGDRLLESGRVLRAVDIALLTELGMSEVSVVRRPRVVMVAARAGPRDAVGPMIRALVSRDGGVCTEGGSLDRDRLPDVLTRRGPDLLLVAGGSGFGSDDHSAAVLADAGEVAFRGVAINPGDTTTIGQAGNTLVVILPGPPLGALFAYDALAGRAVRRLAGRGGGWPYGTCRAVLARKVASSLGRLEYCRVRLEDDSAFPLAVSDGRTLSTAVRADGFVLVPSNSEGFAQGSEVTVHLYDQRF